jgi:hypothetical protein
MEAGFEDCCLYEDTNQWSETGNHNTIGFNEHCWQKLQVMIDQEIGSRVVYLDADCIVYPGFADWCNNWFDNAKQNEIGHGYDGGDWCMGVVLFTQTNEIRRWFRFVKEYSLHRGLNDQGAHRELRIGCTNFETSCSHLDKKVVANLSSYPDISKIDQNVLCFHANYVVGVNAKTELLDAVDQHRSKRIV